MARRRIHTSLWLLPLAALLVAIGPMPLISSDPVLIPPPISVVVSAASVCADRLAQAGPRTRSQILSHVVEMSPRVAVLTGDSSFSSDMAFDSCGMPVDAAVVEATGPLDLEVDASGMIGTTPAYRVTTGILQNRWIFAGDWLTFPPPLGQWRVLVLAYSEMNVNWPESSCGPAGFLYQSDGSPHRPGPSDAYIGALAAARRLPAVVDDWSNGRVTLKATVVEMDHPITKVSITADRDIWPTPEDLSSDIARYAPEGRYDGIFVVWPYAYVPYHGGTFGLTIGPTKAANGAAYTTISEMSETLWSDTAEPAEVFVHELLHQIIFTATDRGVEGLPDLDQSAALGYSSDQAGSYRAWYSDYLIGQIPSAGEGTRGLTQEVWARLNDR